MTDLTGWTDLTDKIHEAALNPSLWKVFLTALCATLNSPMGIIWGQDASGRLSGITKELDALNIGLGPHETAMVAAKQAQRFIVPYGQGAVVHGTMPFPEAGQSGAAAPAMLHSASAIVEKSNHRSVTLTLFRHESVGPYAEDELACLQKLVPHLQTAFVVHRRLYRLHALAHASTTALDAIPFGLLLLDHAGYLLHANAQAQRMIESTSLLKLQEGVPVHCSRQEDQVVFRRLMDRVVGNAMPARPQGNGVPGGAQRLTSQSGKELHLLVTSLQSRTTPFGEHAGTAVFISDPATLPGTLLSSLRSIYSMTPAEARLTEALANGRTLQEYAGLQSLSMNTVRTQLKATMAKAGVRRQSDLVRIVLTGPAVFEQAGAR